MDIFKGIFRRRKPVLYCLEDTHNIFTVQRDIVDCLVGLKSEKGVTTVFQENIPYGLIDPDFSLNLQDIIEDGRVRELELPDGRLYCQGLRRADGTSNGAIPATKYLVWARSGIEVIGVEDPTIYADSLRHKMIHELALDIYKTLFEKYGFKRSDVYDSLMILRLTLHLSLEERDIVGSLSQRVADALDYMVKKIPERNEGMARNIIKEIKERKLQSAAYVCGIAHLYDPGFRQLFEPNIQVEILETPSIPETERAAYKINLNGSTGTADSQTPK